MQRISDRTARVAVVGLGYVGLPLACVVAEAGYRVVGIEHNLCKVVGLWQKICPIVDHEPGLFALFACIGNGLEVTADPADCAPCDVILLAVETPITSDHRPDYTALRSALADIAPHVQPGALVIIESTLAPGTMRDVVAPALPQALLAHCPERLMPGKALRNIYSMDRVIGAMTPEAGEAARLFYSQFVQGLLDVTDCLTAEITKCAENAYRDVQIAFANELALLCEGYGADVWQVRELVNRCPGRDVPLPGSGVGGHCIPKDPWLLTANAPMAMHCLTVAARRLNDYMPLHVLGTVRRALCKRGVSLRGARVAVLGLSYLPNCGDCRNSPSDPLVSELRELGATVATHDPYVPGHDDGWLTAVRDADCCVLMVAHDVYGLIDLRALAQAMRTPILIDTRRAFDANEATTAGLEYHLLGRGECQMQRP